MIVSRFKYRDFLELTKPGLVLFVIFTASLGYLLASGGAIIFSELLLLVFGVYLSGSAVHILNQAIEYKSDAKMERTRKRPICEGKISPGFAYFCGTALLLLSLCIFYYGINAKTAFLCLLVSILYLIVYTPLKKVTVWNTWVGAIPGAIPALMGWSARWGTLDPEAWVLFLIVYFWQIPHFLALAWKYKFDYQKGGHKMLTLFDEKGKISGWHSIIHILFLIEISLAPFFLNRAGVLYLTLALLLGFGFLYFAVHFLKNPNHYSRKMFLYSIFYLPVLYTGLLFENLNYRYLESSLVSLLQP